MAQAQFDRGPVDPGTPMERMILVLGASAEQEHQARTLLDSQQTKGSPDYHHWLTPEEFGQKFGPSPQDIQQVTAWLQQQGFSVGSVAKSGRWIEFSGTAAQVNQAFQTQMRHYQVEGKLHTSNSSNVTIPAALAPVLLGVASLHDFYSQPMIRRSKLHPTATLTPGNAGTAPNITFTDGTHGIAPPDFALIYNLNPLYTANITGSGQTIAIVAVSNINTVATTGIDDVGTFQALFGLPLNPPNIILNGPDPGVVGGADEASLDVEWSGAVAPFATIDLVVSGGTLTTDPVLLSSQFIVDQNLAPIMNVSFGNCEQALGIENPLWNALWEQAAAQGVSVFVSSGDTGAAGCDPNGGNTTVAQGGLGVNGVGSTPFNTSVGGTEFNESVNGGVDATFWSATNNAVLGSALGYIPEKVWNDSCVPTDPGSVCQQFNFISLASGGGGISTLYSQPSWQSLSITGLTGAGFTNRVMPDVALTAANEHDPLVFCFSSTAIDCQGTVSVAGGTSFSSPSFAGIMALVDQKIGKPQGLANYVLYPLGATESSTGFAPCDSSKQTNPAKPNPAFKSCIFVDTTAGNNGVPGNDTLTVASPGNNVGQLGYNAITGFDLGTGLGSVNANNLVNAWATLATGFQGTTTTLSASFNGTPLPSATVTITHGQAVSITVSVARQGTTGTPSGNVALLAEGGNLSSTVGVTQEPISGSGGTATAGPVNVNNLPGGTSYNILANYPGDGIFGSGASNTISVTVGAENSTTTLKSDIFSQNTLTFAPGTTVAYGDPVNILVIDATAVGASGLVPTSGTVTFSDNSVQIAQIPVDNSGIAELASCFLPLTACLAPGSHSIVAVYGGDGPLSFNGSTSLATVVTVTPGTATVGVSGPATVIPGQQFTLQAQVQPGGLASITPSGSVQFFDGTTALGGAVTLSAGLGSAQVTLTTGGAHSITARYSGDGNYNTATSAVFTITVTAPFNFTATSSSQTIAAGATATYSVTLSGVGGFTGAVNFNCTGAPGSSTCAVSPNPANLSSTTTSVPLTVTVSNTANARLAPAPFKTLPFVFAAVFAGLLWGVRRKPRQAVLMVLALALIVGVGSCGGGGTPPPPPPPPPPTIATLTVTGTNGSSTNTITLTLTITH